MVTIFRNEYDGRSIFELNNTECIIGLDGILYKLEKEKSGSKPTKREYDIHLATDSKGRLWTVDGNWNWIPVYLRGIKPSKLISTLKRKPRELQFSPEGA